MRTIAEICALAISLLALWLIIRHISDNENDDRKKLLYMILSFMVVISMFGYVLSEYIIPFLN